MLRYATRTRPANVGQLRRNGTRVELPAASALRPAGVHSSAQRYHWSATKSQTRVIPFRQRRVVEPSTDATINDRGVVRKAAWLALFAALASTLVGA